MQVKKTIIHLAIVLAFAQCALAEEVITASGFTTGTSFEALGTGDFIAGRDDSDRYTGSTYWVATNAAAGTSIAAEMPVPKAVVTKYDPGAAYPYAGTERNELFTGANAKYLVLDLESKLTLGRRVMASNVETNILLRSLKDGIYADTLAQLTPCISSPDVEGSDKIVVWLREGDCAGGTTTNLVITAGRYAGGFGKVERCDYVIAEPFVAAATWCRLTIRMIGDITGKQGADGSVSGEKAAAFTVYVDGKPACADASYDIGSGYREDWIVPEARVLISERRLFPCLAPAGYDGATEVSIFAFDGQGAVDDVAISTKRPGHVVSDNIFTLKWDAGVKSMTCVVARDATVTTNEIDAAALPRFRDYTLGTSRYAQVTVTNVVYDTAHDYSNGTWRAENDCTVAGNVFTYDGKSANPIGFVASTRDVIDVGLGTGCAATFAEAKELARTNGVRTIALQSDMVITSGKQSGDYNDKGRFLVEKGDDIILDLCGHTLQGYRNPTVWQTGGSLCITDSSSEKTGRVLPGSDNIAVQSISSSKDKPALTIDAGWYDGVVVITNTPAGAASGTYAINGGGFTNAYEQADHFYLEQYVTNATAYFGLSADNYWTPAVNGFIWCGKGASANWNDPANWRGKAVPQADDLAIFPRIEGGGKWTVDFGEGVGTKRLWLDADIDMRGTNEFSGVTVVSGKGRLVGTGTAKFTGTLPGVLTAGEPGTGIRIGEGWKGTVRVAGIAKAQPLTNIMGWGNAASKVEFAGVRGYLSDRANYALPFGLILTDDASTPAWRNDTGYTGSVVSFPTLEGTGTFLSPKNTREILQVFQFQNVEAFKGAFNLGGKRLLLGTGAVARKATAGHYTFANAVKVRSGLGWQGVSAHFGSQLGVYGAFGDSLMTFTGAAPDVSGVEVVLTNAQGEQLPGELEIDGMSVRVMAKSAKFSINGKSVSAMEVASVVRDGYVIEVPAGSALAIADNQVIVNGKVVAKVSDNYKVEAVGSTSYAVSFNAEAVTPTLASFTVGSSGGRAVVQVENAKPGFWYGLQTISSLAESWDAAPTAWKRAEGESVAFEPDIGDTSSFYRVIMTDKDPNGGEE